MYSSQHFHTKSPIKPFMHPGHWHPTTTPKNCPFQPHMLTYFLPCVFGYFYLYQWKWNAYFTVSVNTTLLIYTGCIMCTESLWGQVKEYIYHPALQPVYLLFALIQLFPVIYFFACSCCFPKVVNNYWNKIIIVKITWCKKRKDGVTGL